MTELGPLVAISKGIGNSLVSFLITNPSLRFLNKNKPNYPQFVNGHSIGRIMTYPSKSYLKKIST